MFCHWPNEFLTSFSCCLIVHKMASSPHPGIPGYTLLLKSHSSLDVGVQGTRLTESSGAKEMKSGEVLDTDLLVRLLMPSNAEALCLVRAMLERATELLHFEENQSRAIVRSVDEALANVIRHAYLGKTDLPIEVTCKRLRGDPDGTHVTGLEILLEDSGIALDPAKLKGRPLEDLRPGGLGLHFIRQSMDEVEFSHKNGKNQLRMVKYIVPATVTKPEGE